MFSLKPDADITEFLKQDGWIKKEENVYHAEKAFVANGTIRYYLEKFKRKEVEQGSLFSFFNILEQYKLGTINFYWKDGTLFARPLNAGRESDT